MVNIFECLIQAIVGKGLYEQYIQRQTVGEVHAILDLPCDQRYVQTRRTRGLPHAPLCVASPTSCIESDATNSPPAALPAPKSTPATSFLKIRPSSTTALAQSPLLKPIETALMPEYNVVHNHYFRKTEDLKFDDPNIMQSYEYGPLDIGPAIGFQAPTNYRRVRAPPRKVTELENLPSLSSAVAAEIARTKYIRDQAGILARIRKAQEKESEGKRRANRAVRTRVPPYVAHVPTSYNAEDPDAALLSDSPPTPLIRPKSKHLRTQSDQHMGQARHRADDQGHVRWTPKPTSQRRRDSTALEKKSNRGKQTKLRKGSKGC